MSEMDGDLNCATPKRDHQQTRERTLLSIKSMHCDTWSVVYLEGLVVFAHNDIVGFEICVNDAIAVHVSARDE